MIYNTIKLIALMLLTVFQSNLYAQGSKLQKVFDQQEIAKLKKAVENNPDSLQIHNTFIDALGVDNPVLLPIYEKWVKKYPKSATVPFAYGHYLSRMESPETKRFLLEAVKRDSTLVEAFLALGLDAERRGDKDAAMEFYSKAVVADPKDPKAAFYYANHWRHFDRERWIQESLQVAKNFPNHQRGAQALFWLAERSDDRDTKMHYYQLVRDRYDVEKFPSARTSAREQIEYMLDFDPAGAMLLAEEMSKKDGLKEEFTPYFQFVKKIYRADAALQQGKADSALAIYQSIDTVPPAYYKYGKKLPVLVAKAMFKAGKSEDAFQSLLIRIKSNPTGSLLEGIYSFGRELGKTNEEIKKSIHQVLYSPVQPATDFLLKGYSGNQLISLKDYRGKVILLTYWFPGCGPCRAEFPSFERVYKKFEGQEVAYLGLNIISRQNDFVLPFLKETGYSFTPLDDGADRQKGNLDNKNRAPVNFMIDREGNIIFSNFRIDRYSEDELEMMFNLLLDKS